MFNVEGVEMKRNSETRKESLTWVAATGAASLMLAACSGAGELGGGSNGGNSEIADSIDVIAINLPAEETLAKLTPEHFTAETGIEVNFTLLPENDVRAKITQEYSSQAGNYDVATLSNYEIPFYAENGW